MKKYGDIENNHLRLGQTFVNDFYQITGVNPILFYERDDQKAIEIIRTLYVNG